MRHAPRMGGPLQTNKRPLQIKTRAFLANLAIFSEMAPAELDRIAAATVPMYFAKGQSIVQCGDACTGFHLVVYGQVKLAFTSSQGVEKVLEIIRPGQSFGEALVSITKLALACHARDRAEVRQDVRRLSRRV